MGDSATTVSESERRNYLVGYGSLVHSDELLRFRKKNDLPITEPVRCMVQGYRRTWDVAMDNSLDIPGYKYYVDQRTGRRAPWFVTFLNLKPDRSTSICAVAFEVPPEQMAAFDEREENYGRHDISEHVSPRLSGPVWAYLGTDASKERFERGCRLGRAVVPRSYFEAVDTAYRKLGPEEYDNYLRTTDPVQVPVIELRRMSVLVPGPQGRTVRNG